MPTIEDRIQLWNGVRPGEAWLAEDDGAIVGVVGVTQGEIARPARRPRADRGRRRRRAAAHTPRRSCATSGTRARCCGRSPRTITTARSTQRHGWTPDRPSARRCPACRALPARAVSVALAGRRHRPRGRALPPARRRRALDPAPRSSRAWRRAVEAGRVTDEPPPGATAARGSVYVRDLVDRSVVFVCRRDGGEAGRRDAVGAGGRGRAAAGPAPVTDALKRDDERRRDV